MSARAWQHRKKAKNPFARPDMSRAGKRLYRTKGEVRETNKRLRSTKRLVSLTSEAGGFVAGLWRLGQPGRLFPLRTKVRCRLSARRHRRLKSRKSDGATPYSRRNAR